jgi:hypothetical protein
VQKANFEHEIRDLKAGRQVNSKSKLKLLNPFIDNSGMIRVGGRLSNSQYSHDKKYPIVLPKGHVTRLILENTHRDQLHAGPTATLAAVREKFWPLDGRSEIRKIVHRCIPCFRAKPHDNNPIMGNLPSHRVKASRPFTNCDGAPGFAQPNGGFTGLTVGARERTHCMVLCKTFIYIYTILWTVRPYSRCWVK